MLTGPPRDGTFQCAEDLSHLIVALARMKQRVDVVRHDHVRPEIEIVRITRGSERVDDPSTGSIVREQGDSVVAGVRKKMRMAGRIPGLPRLADRLLHSFRIPLLREQWHTGKRSIG